MLAERAADAFSADEIELLQELMNIAFGEAAARLADARGRHLDLAVPDVQVMPAVLLRYYVGAELKDLARLCVVEQAWSGALAGTALLLLPEAPALGPLDEVGRMLVGGCVGKLAALLGAEVTFAPATVAVEERRAAVARAGVIAPGHTATVLRALFRVGSPATAGYLFLAPSADAVPWLKGALQRFLEQYR